MGNNDFILDGIRWSYSSVNSYRQCPQAFRYGYLDALPRVDNAFSDWGSFMHSILEKYFSGELEFFELSQLYVDRYQDNVKCAFPPNNYCDLGERYYKAGKDYLDSFDGLFEDYTVIGVELAVKMDIEERPFVGIIDLLLEKDDEYIVVDHKSKSRFKSKRERMEYARQLYLYSLYVKEKYGKFPSKLVFHMVRAGGELIEIPFDQDELDAAVKWFTDTIDAIYQDVEFMSTPNKIRRDLKTLRDEQMAGNVKFDDYLRKKKKLESELRKNSFFCWNLCGSREVCQTADKAPREG